METKTVFLKRTESGRYKIVTDISDSDYVRVPTEKYVSIRDWHDLIDENEKLRDRCRKFYNGKYPIQDGDLVTIPKEEYNGLKNTLRIIRDRGRQQVVKSSPDKFGYTLKYADERVIDRSFPDIKAYYISRSSPYSLKIDLENAYFLIRTDLEEFYNYIDLSSANTPAFPKSSALNPVDLVRAIKQRDDPAYNQEFYLDNTDAGRRLKEFVDILPETVAFGSIRINGNIGQGVYEVSYWASSPI